MIKCVLPWLYTRGSASPAASAHCRRSYRTLHTWHWRAGCLPTTDEASRSVEWTGQQLRECRSHQRRLVGCIGWGVDCTLTPSSSSMMSFPIEAKVVHLQLLVALTAQRLWALNLHTEKQLWRQRAAVIVTLILTLCVLELFDWSFHSLSLLSSYIRTRWFERRYSPLSTLNCSAFFRRN